MVAGGLPDRPSIILTGLVNGTYDFTLTVTNKNGLSSSDHAVVRVLEDPMAKHVIQIHLDNLPSKFTQSMKVRTVYV